MEKFRLTTATFEAALNGVDFVEDPIDLIHLISNLS
jgi:hypothetical protein